MIGKTISHYKILEELGRGGMGVVYKAEDVRLKRTVALKFLPPEFTRDPKAKKRFLHEARAAAALDHPNICAVHEIDEVDGQTFIVMGYIEGQSLMEKIDSGPLKINEALEIAIQIAQGLQAAHERGIVHRDIKPANILITTEGLVKILDFGLAKLADQIRITTTSTTVGTVAYMSPEQAQGEEVDFRTDIWSLGVVLYEMLTGKLPFKGEYEASVIYSIINEKYEPVSKIRKAVPAYIDEVIKKCLEKKLEQRYQKIELFMDDLSQMAAVSEKRFHRRRKDRVWRFKKSLFAIALLFMVAVFITLFFHIFIPTSKAITTNLKGMSSIAVMYFENATEDKEIKWLSRGLPHMLITDLEQNPSINVVSYQRLYDILKKIGNKGSKTIDRNIATQIAKKAHVKIMLLGNIFKWNDLIRVDYELHNVNTGDLIYADKVIENNPFIIADKIAHRVIQKMGGKEHLNVQPNVMDVTTHSLQAYRFYLKGKDFENKGRWQDAFDCYSKATNLDTTFALAYLRMWKNAPEIGMMPEERNLLLKKAAKYANNTSERERLMILAEEAHYYGKLREFREISEELIQKYPNYVEFYELLGDYHLYRREFRLTLPYYKKWAILSNYSPRSLENIIHIYMILGEDDSVAHYINRFQALHPNEPFQLMMFSGYLVQNGQFEKALQVSKEAVQINPNVPWTHRSLGMDYFFNGKYDSAEVELSKLEKFKWETTQIYELIKIWMYQGKYKTIKTYLKNLRQSPKRINKLYYAFFGEKFYYLSGKSDSALQCYQDLNNYKSQSVNKYKGDTFIVDSLLHRVLHVYIYKREFRKALHICDLIFAEISKKDLGGGYYLTCQKYKADILYNSHRYNEAAQLYKKIVREQPLTFYLFRLAELYYRLKKYNESVELLQRITKVGDLRYDKFDWKSVYAFPRKFYLLGLNYETLGENEKAIEAYTKLMDIWKNVDKDLPELIDAKKRLAKLKQE